MIDNALTSEAAAVTPAGDDPALCVLLVDLPTKPRLELADALRSRNCQVIHMPQGELAEHVAGRSPGNRIVLGHGATLASMSDGTITLLRRLRVPVMMLSPAGAPLALPSYLCDTPPATATGDEIFGRACMLVRMARHARRMRAKVHKLKRVGRHLQDNYQQIDNELLLAGQLQRDFLPKQLPSMPGMNFVTLMRPYSWVSGDIYDIFRIDENHVGMYVADAVGHGVAAGLLTMFIKQALIAKRVTGNHYRVLSPAEVLQDLNQSMATHDLPNCQYVTICYVVVNFRTMRAQVARAAHPAPLLVSRDGQIQPVESDPGCVIGVFGEQQFSQVELDLQPGQKLVLFSDGLEEAFGQSPVQRNRWLRILQHNAGRDIHTIFRKLEKAIDRTRGSLHPEDDITAIGLEVTGNGQQVQQVLSNSNGSTEC